jgi:hypothetical protein
VIQCIPLATEPGISLIILPLMRILQQNLKRAYTYTNMHEQQPYCVGTLSQMIERSAERCVRQETGWLAGGRADRCCMSQQLGALQAHATDTFLLISHITNVPLFKFRCNIFIGVRIINLYRTDAPSPFKSASYERTKSFKCPVHSCRGLEL